MKEALQFRRHHIAWAVWLENSSRPHENARHRVLLPLPTRRGAGSHLAATDIRAAFVADDPAIAASMTAYALTPCLFIGTVSIESP